MKLTNQHKNRTIKPKHNCNTRSETGMKRIKRKKLKTKKASSIKQLLLRNVLCLLYLVAIGLFFITLAKWPCTEHLSQKKSGHLSAECPTLWHNSHTSPETAPRYSDDRGRYTGTGFYIQLDFWYFLKKHNSNGVTLKNNREKNSYFVNYHILRFK